MTKLRGLSNELAEVRQLRASVLESREEETDREEADDEEGISEEDDAVEEGNEEADGEEVTSLDEFAPVLGAAARLAGTALARGASAVGRGAAAVGRGVLKAGRKVAGGVAAALAPKKSDNGEKDEASLGIQSIWVPTLEDFNRLTGRPLKEDVGPTQEEFDMAALLAVMGEMVQVDLLDMLQLSEEEEKKVVEAIEDLMGDHEVVRSAANIAFLNGARVVIEQLLSNPDKRAEVTAKVFSIAEKSEKWIQKAIKKPGALHKQMGVAAGKTIPAKDLKVAASKHGKMGKRARLAMTLKKLTKEDQEASVANLQERSRTLRKKLKAGGWSKGPCC